MKILAKLTDKPWLTPSASSAITSEIASATSNLSSADQSAKTALLFFLLVVSILFMLITITFLGRSQYPDFQPLAGDPWLPFTRPVSLWINTGFLLLASISIQFSVLLSKKAQLSLTLVALCGACIFTANFLIGQVSVWIQLSNYGYLVNANPANSYFYLFTGIHGLHICAGFMALFRAMCLFWRHSSLPKLSAGISLMAIYWHYLFVVWLFLFALLTATSETYKAAVLLCGF